MSQPLEEALVEAAREAVRSDPWERNRVAWNLPPYPVEADSALPAVHDLDWAGFSETFYPGTRRHHLSAIVAYGAYRGAQLGA